MVTGLHRHTNKHFLQDSDQKLGKPNWAHNQGINVPITTKDIRKEDRHENPIQGDIVQRVLFKSIFLFLVLNFQIICQYPRSQSTLRETEHDTTFEIS